MGRKISVLMMGILCIGLCFGCASSKRNAPQEKGMQSNELAVATTSVAICEILDTLDYQNVVGVPETSGTLPERYTWVDTIGAPMNPDIEVVKSISPDLLLSPKSLESSLAEQYQSASIEAEFLDMSTVQGMYKGISMLGEKLGREEQAEQLYAEYESYMEEYIFEELENANCMILMCFPGGKYLIATENSYVGNLVELAGGNNVYSNYQGDENGFVAINPEDMVNKNPEYIFVYVEVGKVTALIGANGCGKSTLFRLFSGQLKPESGEVYLDGTAIRSMNRKEVARRMAVVHQYNTAPVDITVRRLVEMGRTPYQSRFSYSQKKEDEEAVENALLATNTKQYENHLLSRLSGGQRQRVWLAMALAQEPKVLLLDEITTYLDVRYQIELLSLIRRLNKEKKLTVLMVLHDINQSMEYADEIIVMKDGKILTAGNTQKVISEAILDEAFSVKTEILPIKERKYCLFYEK